MKKVMFVVSVSIIAVGLTGCVTSKNLAPVIEALSKDNASIHGKLNLSTPWGTETLEFDRTMPTNAPAK